MSSIQRVCSIEECNKPLNGRGYCAMHYRRFMKYGDTNTVLIVRQNTGLPRDSIKNAWTNIKQRCLNPAHARYKHYGARGIQICEGWRTSYSSFHQDMSPKPSPKHSIDRRDNDGHYSCGKCEQCIENGWPMNCRWTTQNIQIWNQRTRPDSPFGYKGVNYAEPKHKYFSKIGYTQDGKSGIQWCGYHNTPEEAAIAYDIACIFFRGEYAVTNIL